MQPWGAITQDFEEGPYSIDVDRMWKLYYDRRRTENYTNSKFCSSESADSFLLPKVKNMEVNWDAAAADARGYADTNTATIMYKLSARQISSAASLRQALKSEYGSLESARCRFTRQIQDNARANSAALKSNVDNWETAISIARGTRTASATILAVGAVVITGGAATGAAFTGVTAANAAGAGLALTAVGSGLTGVGKAQDSERHLTTEQAVGVAVVSGSFDFVTTVLTGSIAKGAKLAWAGKALVGFFVKVPTKTATSIMLADMTRRKDEPATSLGAHAWSAVQDWAVDVAAGAVADKLMKIPQVNAALRKIAVVGANVIKESSADVKGLLVTKLVHKAADKGGQAATKALSNATVRTAASIVSGGAPKGELPEAVVRQPIHGGAALEPAVLNAIMSPLSS